MSNTQLPTLLESGGETFLSLSEAQKKALPDIASSFADAVRSLLISGALVIEHGRVIINPTQRTP